MDWAELVNGNVQQNIVSGLQAGLLVEGIKYLPSLDRETQEQIIMDKDREFGFDGVISFPRGGVPISLCGYYDGKHVINRTTILNFPELLTGGQGEILTANMVTVFKNQTKLGEHHLKKLRDHCLRNTENFSGWMSIDCAWKGDRLHYRRIRIGVLHDIAFAMAHLYGVTVDWINGECIQLDPVENFSASLRLYGYPYDPELNESLVEGIETADTEHFTLGDGCYLVNGIGNKINKAWTSLYEKIPEHLPSFGVCFRTDGLIESQKRFNKLLEAKLI